MIELRKIDAGNYQKILGMELPRQQQSFVASNAASLAEARGYFMIPPAPLPSITTMNRSAF